MTTNPGRCSYTLDHDDLHLACALVGTHETHEIYFDQWLVLPLAVTARYRIEGERILVPVEITEPAHPDYVAPEPSIPEDPFPPDPGPTRLQELMNQILDEPDLATRARLARELMDSELNADPELAVLMAALGITPDTLLDKLVESDQQILALVTTALSGNIPAAVEQLADAVGEKDFDGDNAVMNLFGHVLRAYQMLEAATGIPALVHFQQVALETTTAHEWLKRES